MLNPTDCAVLNLRSVGLSFGCSCGHGRRSRFIVFVLQYSAVTAALEGTKLGQIIDAAGPDGGPQVLVEVLTNYLDSRCRLKLVEYPLFNLRLFKRCLRRTAASVLIVSSAFEGAIFVMNLVKGAPTRDWMVF